MWTYINKCQQQRSHSSCSTLYYYKSSHQGPDMLNMVMRLYFLQAVYLSVTFSQLIIFQIAFR